MKYFNLHTHTFSNQSEVVELVNQYPQEFKNGISHYSIGIHPWHVNKNQIASDLSVIESKLKDPNCLAIGECGLDKRTAVSFELQQIVFEKQLLLAQEYQKPVVIHCVAAFQELIQLKTKLKISVPLVIHGYSKNVQLAKDLVSHGFYISFGKNLLRLPQLESVFSSIPSDHFFLETDTDEQSIQEVYSLASQYKGISIDVLQNQIISNFKQVFDTNNLIN